MTVGKVISTAIRIVLDTALLWTVWCNSHWSVAVTLTLLSINTELRNWQPAVCSRKELWQALLTETLEHKGDLPTK